MNLEQSQLNCQIPCLELVAEGIAGVPPESLSRVLKLKVRRRLDSNRERKFKNYTNDFINKLCMLTGRDKKPVVLPSERSSESLETGDWVRVRSLEEIKMTLNHWRQVKGCGFMPELAEFCGTTQRVLKSMKRFVDERDHRVKKSSGIILLDGVTCQGTAEFGECDRACLHFWRKEWLQKVDESSISPSDERSMEEKRYERVRVRPLEEIEATLDQSRQLKGCAFMPEMAEYCGTTQRVLKPVKRFVDERDFRVKRTSGLVLLDGIVCHGRSEFSSCDRTCSYMWREEWLEKVGEQA